MSKKNFVMINTNLLECRRFRRLETCCQRNAYFTSLLSSRANYIGLFHFPMWLLAQEADVQPEEAMALIESLQDVGLIAYDQDDEMIRHIEWFYSSNISLSENTVKRAAKDFLDRRVPRTDFVGKAIAEFVVAALLDVQAYNSASEHGEVVTEELRSFLVAATPLYSNLEAFLVEEIRLNGTVGDFAFGPKSKDRKWLSNLYSRLPGAEKHLVVGNHDGEATQALPWNSVTHLTEVADGAGSPSVLCHYPMITWHKARKGALHLFGHVHEQWMGSRNAVNVGVDVWGYVPVTIRDIQQRAKTLPVNKHWDDVEHNAEIS